LNEPVPDPDLVGDLFWGVFKPQLLRMALQIDLFSPLAAGPASAETVAHTCGCALPGIRALLDYFASLHIIEKQGDQYRLSLTAETFLVPGRKAYSGDMILDYTGLVMYDSVLASLRSGQPSELGENFVQDAWLESYSTWRVPKSLEMWQAAGVEPGPGRPFHLLDVACGCAIKSLALAQASPTVQVTSLDSPEVLEVARDLAERLGLGARVAYQPADFLQAELGSEQYDAVLIGQITHYLTEGQNRDLFRRIYGSLVENGLLVIDCPMLTDPPDELTSFLTLFLWANSGGGTHRFEEYRDWLLEAGFNHVKQLSERWLRAMK
jgi:2-polyprenyl-3-methyl-5-hydroxy-6-metoxy-1,4-benzoquinol methylase